MKPGKADRQKGPDFLPTREEVSGTVGKEETYVQVREINALVPEAFIIAKN